MMFTSLMRVCRLWMSLRPQNDEAEFAVNPIHRVNRETCVRRDDSEMIACQDLLLETGNNEAGSGGNYAKGEMKEWMRDGGEPHDQRKLAPISLSE